MSKLTPPYGRIYSSLNEGKLIPFLGAGASLIGRNPADKWKYRESRFLPSGTELARYLADQSSFPSNEPQDLNDLAKVASYYANIMDREDLRDCLRDIMLNDSYQFRPLHAFLASLPTPLIIVVTNYDTLLEQAFLAQGREYDLVVYPSTSDTLDNPGAILWWPQAPEGEPKLMAPSDLAGCVDLNTTPIIFKMHGTVSEQDSRWDKFVITEEDYVDFLSRLITGNAIPNLLMGYFRRNKCRFLFLGYSLRDWNLRVVFNDIKNKSSRKSWAILNEPSELEKLLWRQRGVELFDATLEDFELEMQKEIQKAKES